MDSCFSSLIRLSKYFSSRFMSQWGINFSGIRWMMENDMFSSLLNSLWKKSFTWLRSLISISIVITSLKIFLCSLEISELSYYL